MLYQQAFEIEQRLNATLQLIRTGRYSTPKLAQALRVSIPTVSRCVQALRERGHDIRAARRADGWSYVLVRKARNNGHHEASSRFANAPQHAHS